MNSLIIDTTLAVTTNATIGGTLAVTGNTALDGTGNTLASADFTDDTGISNTKKHQFENLAGALDAAIWEDASDDLIIDSTNEIKFQLNNETDIISADDWLTGWWPVQETWTFASDDDPTYTLTVPTDLTGKYEAGMRVKLTDSGTQYFIITKVAYSSPSTTLTLYGGTSHAQGALSGGAITVPHFSIAKKPLGFSINPDDWTEKVTDMINRSQAAPVVNTWYNLNNSIDIPIGSWRVFYEGNVQGTDTANGVNCLSTLSTANNSESDSEFTGHNYMYNADGASKQVQSTIHKEKIITLIAKDTYYYNIKTTLAGVTDIYETNATVPLVIKAICVYL